MIDLLQAKVDDTDDSGALFHALDEAQDALDREIRIGGEYRSIAPGEVSRARSTISDRIWTLCEALREARSALRDETDRAAQLGDQLDEANQVLQDRYRAIVERDDTIAQLRTQLAEVQHA